MRINPYELKPAVHTLHTRRFTENGNELSFTLRESRDLTRRYQHGQMSREYVRLYVTGEPALDDKGAAILGPDGKPVLVPRRPRPVPIVENGEQRMIVPVVDEALCYNVALLETQQVPDGGDARLTFDEWLALCVLVPDTMERVFEWSAELVGRPADEAKNVSGSDAAPSSEPA